MSGLWNHLGWRQNGFSGFGFPACGKLKIRMCSEGGGEKFHRKIRWIGRREKKMKDVKGEKAM
ncbi:hypothetical protein [uncultured Bacteroides sp.]|uniref:hypothetical protein n=1 Tax=uncultured Bacteroides sp. TaxID=162156 RepID=UPI0025918144|nr:hypothetical protein [uncultured Bacteroides sp.]